MSNLSSFGVLKQKVNKYKVDLNLESDTDSFTRLLA